MKQKRYIHITFLSLFIFFTGCASKGDTRDFSQKKTEIITNTTITKKPGFMQNALDDWFQSDWEPTIEKEEAIKEKYEANNSKSFTLQEYVDKIGAYQKAKPNDYNTSHQKQMESLPVIGK